jgi:hypothetical protein
MFVLEYMYVFVHMDGQGWCAQLVCKETASLFSQLEESIAFKIMNDCLELSQSQWLLSPMLILNWAFKHWDYGFA